MRNVCFYYIHILQRMLPNIKDSEATYFKCDVFPVLDLCIYEKIRIPLQKNQNRKQKSKHEVDELKRVFVNIIS